MENFCVHSRNSYYNSHIFHRVIKVSGRLSMKTSVIVDASSDVLAALLSRVS